MFKVNDSVVHLSHGVGTIKAIEERVFSPDKPAQKFYILEIEDNGAVKKVFVPFETAAQRIRKVIKKTDVQKVYFVLQDKSANTIDHQTWNRRYREYMELIHTGDILNIAKVLKSLFQMKEEKDLSFGERKLLEQAKDLITKELSLAEGLTVEEIDAKLESILATDSGTKLALVR